MRGSNKLIVLTAGVAICSFLATIVHVPVPVMATFAFALLASFGYVWITVILRGRAPALELTSIATGLVLATPVIGGVVLQEVGVPLSRTVWSGLFAAFTLIGDVFLGLSYRGHAREHKNNAEFQDRIQGQDPLRMTRPDWRSPWEPVQRSTPVTSQRLTPRSTERARSWRRVAPLQAGACGLAVLIAGCAIWVARAGAATQHYPGFTELWLSSADHSSSIYNLGVNNEEGKTEKYRLELLRKGHLSAAWDLTLAAGKTWERTVQITGETRADLYLQSDRSQPYRYVDTAP